MSLTTALVLFFGSLVLSMAASAVLVERLVEVGHKLHFPAGLIGIIAALGADAPETASAVSAMIGGQHDLGRGVIFGSNIFNLAALFGVSSLVAGRTSIARPNLVLNGAVALWITLVVGAETMGSLGRLSTGLLLFVVLAPYLALFSLSKERFSRLPVPAAMQGWLGEALWEIEKEGEVVETEARSFTGMDGLSILPLTAMLVVASIGMVRAAEFLGSRWGLSPTLIGTLVIATLTGIPNLIAAISLARKSRGSALASEAFNSNSLNLLVGAYVPTLFIPLSAPSHGAFVSLAWLTAMTLGATCVGLAGRGFGRRSGALLVTVYAIYVFTLLF